MKRPGWGEPGLGIAGMPFRSHLLWRLLREPPLREPPRWELPLLRELLLLRELPPLRELPEDREAPVDRWADEEDRELWRERLALAEGTLRMLLADGDRELCPELCDDRDEPALGLRNTDPVLGDRPCDELPCDEPAEGVWGALRGVGWCDREEELPLERGWERPLPWEGVGI